MSFILFYEIKEQRKITFEEVKMYCSNLVVNIIKQLALTYRPFLAKIQLEFPLISRSSYANN